MFGEYLEKIKDEYIGNNDRFGILNNISAFINIEKISSDSRTYPTRLMD